MQIQSQQPTQIPQINIPPPTVGGLLDFIKANRGDKVFRGWTDDQIVVEIVRAVNDNTLLYCQDSQSHRLTGVTIGRKLLDPLTNEPVMHIVAALTLHKGILLQFFRIFRNMYPTYKLMQANRLRGGARKLTYYPNLEHFQALLERV